MSLKKIVALLVVGLMFGSVIAQDEVSVQNLKREGSLAYKEKKYDVALAKFEEAIKASTEAGEVDVTAVYKAGQASYKGKKYDKSISFFNTVIEKGGNKCQSYYYLADMYKKKDDSEKRIEFLKKGSEECPTKKGKFDKVLAKAYLKAGGAKYNEGAKIQSSVSSLKTTDPKYTAAMDKANKKFKAALVDLEASYAIKAKNKMLLKMLSTVYTNLEMKDKAAKMDAELKALK